MAIDFEKLNEMVESISNVIKDVENETKEIKRNVYDSRVIMYLNMMKDFCKYNDLNKKGTGGKDIYVEISEITDWGQPLYLRFNFDDAVAFCKKPNRDGFYYWIDKKCVLRNEWEELKDDEGLTTRLVESYDDIKEDIAERFAIALQEEMKKKADNVHAIYEETKSWAKKMGYMD